MQPWNESTLPSRVDGLAADMERVDAILAEMPAGSDRDLLEAAADRLRGEWPSLLEELTEACGEQVAGPIRREVQRRRWTVARRMVGRIEVIGSPR